MQLKGVGLVLCLRRTKAEDGSGIGERAWSSRRESSACRVEVKEQQSRFASDRVKQSGSAKRTGSSTAPCVPKEAVSAGEPNFGWSIQTKQASQTQPDAERHVNLEGRLGAGGQHLTTPDPDR